MARGREGLSGATPSFLQDTGRPLTNLLSLGLSSPGCDPGVKAPSAPVHSDSRVGTAPQVI